MHERHHMALADMMQPPAKGPGLPCSVGALLNTLDGDELAALQTMLGTPERPGWTASQVYQALTAEGYSVGYQTINRHRGGNCRCFR